MCIHSREGPRSPTDLPPFVGDGSGGLGRKTLLITFEAESESGFEIRVQQRADALVRLHSKWGY